jgi:hypothetical protein
MRPPVWVGPGPKTRKKYLLVACTNLLTYYFLSDRSLASFEAFVFPDLTGVVVHDRYQNYDNSRRGPPALRRSPVARSGRRSPVLPPARSGPDRSPRRCKP